MSKGINNTMSTQTLPTITCIYQLPYFTLMKLARRESVPLTTCATLTASLSMIIYPIAHALSLRTETCNSSPFVKILCYFSFTGTFLQSRPITFGSPL